MNYLKILILICGICLFELQTIAQIQENSITAPVDSLEISIQKIWEESSYRDVLAYPVFLKAMRGYHNYSAFKRGIIAIIDYSKPSTKKRFYVIDLESDSLLFNTLIAHGKNTGNNTTVHFSNEPKSLKSSLGFFITAETYYGKHGFSLKLDGLEKGINDNARKRAIVIHGASYVNAEFIKQHGRLGRSWGCPALPESKTENIINTISNGTCLFIYVNNKEYLKTSKFLD